MNYQKIYDDLMTKARSRKLEPGIYFENHHIIPRCLGGADSSENLAKLLPEEHYVAHQLLVKLNPGHFGLLSAVTFMTTDKNGRRINNKLFGWLRKEHSKAQTGRKMSDQARINLSKAKKSKPPSEAWLLAIRNSKEKKIVALTGQKRTEETRARIRESRLGTTLSESTKAKMSTARTGKKQSPETIAKRIATFEKKRLAKLEVHGNHICHLTLPPI